MRHCSINIEMLSEGVQMWQMGFNEEKCETLLCCTEEHLLNNDKWEYVDVLRDLVDLYASYWKLICKCN